MVLKWSGRNMAMNFVALRLTNRFQVGSYYITGDEWGKKKRPKYEWSAGKQI